MPIKSFTYLTDVTHRPKKVVKYHQSTNQNGVPMNKDRTELYTDYFLSNFRQDTTTGLSKVVNGDITHDKTTQFLNKEDLTPKQLWTLVKPTIRQLEKQIYKEDKKQNVLIFDDTNTRKSPHRRIRHHLLALRL